jgi:hypothetical protein
MSLAAYLHRGAPALRRITAASGPTMTFLSSLASTAYAAGSDRDENIILRNPQWELIKKINLLLLGRYRAVLFLL